MLPIMTVLQFPMKESLSTRVNLLPLNGVWFLFKSMALMHSLRAKRDLLISAPSSLVYLFWSWTSAPLSLPAKSINESFPWRCFPYFKLMMSRAWDREDSELDEFELVTLTLYPSWMICINPWTLLIFFSDSPTMLTFPLASSLAYTYINHINTVSWALSFKRSKSFPQ